MGGSGAAVGVLAGGRADQVPRLGVDLLRQRPGRRPRLRAGAALRPREPRTERASSPDVAGAVTVTSRDRAARLRGLERPEPRLGIVRLDDRPVLVGRRRCSLAFLFIESRAKDPLMPFSIFRIRTVAGANICSFLLGAVDVLELLHPHALRPERPRLLGALKTGLTFAATAGSAVLWAGLAQALVTKIGAKIVLIMGFVAFAAGIALYTQVPANAPSSATSCRVTCSSASRCRSPSSRSRSRRSRASQARGSRARLGPAQHDPAGRRRDRGRRRLVGLDQPLTTI